MNINLLKEEYGEYVCIFPRIVRWSNFIGVRIHFAYFFVHDIIHTYYSSKNVMQERLLRTKYILCFTISHEAPLSFGLEDFFSDHK